MVSSSEESSEPLPVLPTGQRTHHQTFQPINTELEDDIEETATSSRRFQQAVSSSDEDIEDAPYDGKDTNSHPRSLISSNTPYKHSPIPSEAYDVEFGEHEVVMTENEKKILRKRGKKMACASMSSNISDEEVEWAMKYYDMEGTWACPPEHIRPHRFDYGDGFKIPRSVLTPKLLALGVGAPLRPFYRSVVEW